MRRERQFIGLICIHGGSFGCRLRTDLDHKPDPRGQFHPLAVGFCLITSGPLAEGPAG